jgi:hypothetical protein
VEAQVAHHTFIPVSSLTSHTTLANIMEVESMSSSSSDSYHPSDAQLRVDEDSDHATGELSGDKSGKSTALLPHTAVLSLAPQQQQPHIRQINGQLLTTLATVYGQQVQTLQGPGPIHSTDPSQANEADADEDTNEDNSDDEGSINEWSTKDLEYTSVDGGEHPRMGWVTNDPLSVDYYEIIIPDPTYITRQLIIAPFISYSIQPFKAEVSATYSKGYHVVTRALTPTCVPYHCVPAMPVHIALLNTTPISDTIQSVVSTHFPTHLNAAFKHYCHFQEQKYAAQGRIQRLKDRITSLQELESKMMEKATCILSEMEDANFWGRLYTCNNQVLHQLIAQPIAADTFLRTALSFEGTYTQSALNPQPNPWRHAPGLSRLYDGARNCAYEDDHRHCTHALTNEERDNLQSRAETLHEASQDLYSCLNLDTATHHRPQILSNVTRVRQARTNATIAAPIMRPPVKTCFKCHRPGHVKKHCPYASLRLR